jgi:hypothetical protein
MPYNFQQNVGMYGKSRWYRHLQKRVKIYTWGGIKSV